MTEYRYKIGANLVFARIFILPIACMAAIMACVLMIGGCCDTRIQRTLDECNEELFVCTQRMVNCECAAELELQDDDLQDEDVE